MRHALIAHGNDECGAKYYAANAQIGEKERNVIEIASR